MKETHNWHRPSVCVCDMSADVRCEMLRSCAVRRASFPIPPGGGRCGGGLRQRGDPFLSPQPSESIDIELDVFGPIGSKSGQDERRFCFELLNAEIRARNSWPFDEEFADEAAFRGYIRIV